MCWELRICDGFLEGDFWEREEGFYIGFLSV